MDMQIIRAGFEVAVFGLGGVFAVLILFYCATRIMLIIARKSTKNDE